MEAKTSGAAAIAKGTAELGEAGSSAQCGSGAHFSRHENFRVDPRWWPLPKLWFNKKPSVRPYYSTGLGGGIYSGKR